MSGSSDNFRAVGKCEARVLSKFLVAVGVVVLLAGGSLWYFAVALPGMAFDRLAVEIDKTLHFRPKITWRTKTVVNQTSEVAELATAERRFQQDYFYSNTWMGSTNSIMLRGHFIAKAGFDLKKTLIIRVSDDRKSAEIELPGAQLLSLELVGEDVLLDEGGWWNPLTPAQREDAQNALLQEARKTASQSDLLKTAEANFRSRIEDILRKSTGGSVSVKFVSPVTPAL